MKLSWSSENCSVITNTLNGKFYYYSNSKDREILHKEFGGNNYYKSRTGLTGKGFIPFNPALKIWSTYRTDVNNVCLDINYAFETMTFKKRKFFYKIFFPYNGSNQSEDLDGKIILIIFDTYEDKFYVIKNLNPMYILDCLIGKIEDFFENLVDISIEPIFLEKNPKIEIFSTDKENTFKTRKIVSEIRKQFNPEKINIKKIGNVHHLLKIYKRYDDFVHFNDFGFIDNIQSTDFLVNFDTENSLYQLVKDKIIIHNNQPLVVVKNGTQFTIGKAIWNEELNDYFDYEIEVPILRDIKSINQQLDDGINNKIELRKTELEENRIEEKRIEEVVEKLKDSIISIEEAKKLKGFCEPGINRFLKRYDINTEVIKICDIDDELLESMLTNRDFRSYLITKYRLENKDS